MAKKVGICKNIDCENYNKEVEVASGAEFECPVCHQPLKEKGGKSAKGGGKGTSSPLPKILAGVAVLALAGGGAYWGLSGSDKPAEPAPVEVAAAPDTAKVDSAAVKPEVAEAPAEPVKKEAPAKVMNGRGTINLPYGSYTGDLKNGKPHGYGKITYTVSQKIVPSKDFVASPGDTFEGEFRDGKISGLGYWEHDGNKTAIKL